jgi:hypothetical protein
MELHRCSPKASTQHLYYKSTDIILYNLIFLACSTQETQTKGAAGRLGASWQHRLWETS